ncbi:hypothetical protein [Nonomuraea jiangxiensis]|uniref:Uncharacterized protein n=1 Tax=Nonomuraea jiangxiensis TaxID=633440 RepID=A0A1G9IBR7_9ACTN|nr:hypothetical protein [Nonomuraea jiangxiensis]SDL22566.1 hypothetical protein SAMN05421869_123137 [Nonomuraea jiangxiensis]
MNDPYRIEPEHRPAAPRCRDGRPGLKALLWVVLVVGVAVNLVAGLAMGDDVTVAGLAGGLVGLAALIGLIMLFVNGRRS